MSTQYEQICKDACTGIREVGQYIRSQTKNTQSNISYNYKGKNDFVTDIDKNSEKKLIAILSKIFPEAGFIAEEQTTPKNEQLYNWIIDPIDGTTNFIHNLYPHAISVALVKNNIPLIGIVYEIGLDECFYTWDKAPAYCNGEIIHVSDNKTIDQSLIATGFPYYDYSKMNGFQQTLDHFMRNSQGIRRLGSAATDLAYVACGRFDAFYEYSLKAWDVAAGAFLVQQAGGIVSDFSGKNNYLYGAEIIAANKLVYSEFHKIISSTLHS
ncbi:MAG: inositol monophosphatase family protein [Bacteroidota bacterium]